MYKVRCESEGEGFLLSYGKGSKKLTTLVTRHRDLGFTTDANSKPRFYGKLREVKAAWGAWAAQSYAGGGRTEGGDGIVTDAGSNPACPIEETEDVYTLRQGEIDNEKDPVRKWENYHHYVRLEIAHCQRDPQYVPHRYNRPAGPPQRDPVQIEKAIRQ